MVKYWQPRTKLNGPGYFYGRTESGKTWKMISLAQIYKSRFNYKIWDINGGKYKEEGFWCFPSDQERLWYEFENDAGVMNKQGPKEYKINLYIPCFSNKLNYAKVPELLPRISAKIFTIYFKSITIDDISVVIGDLSKNSIYFWNQIVQNLPDSATGIDIENYVNEKLSKYKELSIYKLFLKPAIDNHLLASKYCPLNINFITEAKEEREAIAVLFHEYIPNKLWSMFFMNYFMRNILDLASEGKISKDNIGIFREAGDYMKKVDKDLKFGDQIQIFRNNLTGIVRYGRRGLILFMDTQSPSDTKNLIEGQEDLLCISEISLIDVRDIVDKLKSERRISRKIRDLLHRLEQKELIIVERREKAKHIKRFQPPRSMCYNGSSFLRVWKNKINSWKPTKVDLKIIYEEYSESLRKIKESKVKKEIIKQPVKPLEISIKKEEPPQQVEEDEIII